MWPTTNESQDGCFKSTTIIPNQTELHAISVFGYCFPFEWLSAIKRKHLRYGYFAWHLIQSYKVDISGAKKLDRIEYLMVL